MRRACARVRERLPSLLDGTLGALERARDEGHLEACAGCSAERARVADLLEDLASLARSTPGPTGGPTGEPTGEPALAAALAALGPRLAARPLPRASRLRATPLSLALPALGSAAAAVLALVLLGAAGARPERLAAALEASPLARGWPARVPPLARWVDPSGEASDPAVSEPEIGR